MKIHNIEKSFYEVFAFINMNDTVLTKKYLKRKKYKVNKEDSKILKNVYQRFEMRSVCDSFYKFKLSCIENSLLTNTDIVVSALKIVNVLKPKK